ncbi:MAG TPA: HEPN domain-containing protein [Thermoanaerobacterium sp.]|nr:HEPN domain-containing protein [Thermoanaerobacterium sp.]
MDDFIKELALYRIEKAKMDLEASKILFDNGLYSQSLNRSYYSIFHAVRAVLAFEQFDSKKHSGIIAYFNRHFINTGIFDRKYSKILIGAERIRNKSDYDDFYIASGEDAEKQLQNAEEFIEAMYEYVKKKLSI